MNFRNIYCGQFDSELFLPIIKSASINLNRKKKIYATVKDYPVNN